MSPSASDAEFLTFLDWLKDHTGLTFRVDQHRHTMTTIRRLMTRAEINDLTDFQLALEQRPGLLADLIDGLTVGETYFFREHRHFDFIRQKILPDIRARREQPYPIRAWSAGCASGEEAYSLAIVFQQEHVSPRPTILATDLSTAALERARQAKFRPWSFRGQASAVMRAYVREADDQYTLREDIKNLVRFQRLNLAENVYPSPASGTSDLDLILCRNVLIYLESESVRDISQRLLECLAPGGWLITASGDPPLIDFANFEVVSTEQGLFYRRPPVSESLGLGTGNEDSRPQRGGSRRLAKPAPQRTETESGSSTGGKARRVAGRETENIGSRIAAAVAALHEGDHARAARLTRNLIDNPNACVVHIKAVAATDPSVAIDACREASERHPLAEELHYLHGVLLADARRNLEALQSVRKAIFLNRSSIMSHFLFASIQRQQGELNSARRHFRSVCELCATGKPDDVLPLSSGETVFDVALAAESQLAQIESQLDP